MNETILSIWLAPTVSFLGVLLGFVATAIFNHTAFTKQIKLLEKELESRFKEIEKQKEIDQQYSLLEKSLLRKQEEIETEKAANNTYVKLRFEFIRLSSIVKEILERIYDYEICPPIDTNMSEIILDPANIQMNILTDVLDTRIYLEIYNRECLSNDYKKELLMKMQQRLREGNNDCFEASNNSLTIIQSLKGEYANLIIKFEEDKTVYM